MKSSRFILGSGLAAAGLFLAHGAAAGTVTLESDRMSVELDDAFPRVIQYTWKADGSVLYGQPEALSRVRITVFRDSQDGMSGAPTFHGSKEAIKAGVPAEGDATKEYTPTVTFHKTGPASAVYELAVPELNVTLTVAVKVNGNSLTFVIPEIKGRGEKKIRAVAFPDHSLVSVRSSQEGAALAAALIGVGDKNQKEVFEAVADKAAEEKPVNWTYAMVSAGKLAATVYGNVLLDKQRLFTRVTEKDGVKSCGLWCPKWAWREAPYERFGAPAAIVLVAPDLNGDGKADWQDAALAYREVAPPPFGAELVPSRAISYIAMNFASWAQHPFLRVLDSMKKVYLYTDGLPQDVQFKGFAGEGHDSSHPDYGGNINRRAGGRGELNFVMERGKAFNVRSGIHINATEYYPEAKTYSPDLVDTAKPGWAWLDQSYLTDRRYDITSGKLYARLDEMHRTLPFLDWVYVDVYWGEGWDAYKLAHKINSLGLPMYTEFESQVDRFVTWNHRSQDWTQRVWGDGLTSKIARFIQNHQKDVWTHSPLLRGSQNDGFLGWHSQNDLKHMVRSVFTCNLPSKYLQAFQITRQADASADFTGGVRATVEDGVSNIYRNGKLLNSAVYKKDHEAPEQNLVFIPWPAAKPAKVYCWHDEAGSRTWDLPEEWAGAKSVKLYELTDLGRVFAADVAVEDGRVALDLKPATPYVLYKDAPAALPAIEWGEGSLVKDPGFDSHSFKWWWVAEGGDTSNVQIVNDEKGQTHLRIAGAKGAEGEVRQRIELKGGKWYSASVWVEVTGKRTATLAVLDVEGNPLAATTVEKTAFTNYSDNSDKYMTRYQRIKVAFRAPRGGITLLSLRAGVGAADAAVCFDDVRVVATEKPDMKGHAFFENFENVDEGWGPFVYGYKGEMRTHLAEAHHPYTDDTIDGRFSLKTFDESDGLNFRSLPALLPLKPDTRYRVSFDYLTQNDKQYKVVVRSDEGGEKAECLAQELPGKDLKRQRFTAEFKTGPFGDCYFGFIKSFAVKDEAKKDGDKAPKRDNRAVLVIDNFAVDEVK